ncbi:signal peptidase II [Snodgrassella sp. CFCC 13594]|uniref:signal peptidase II n=1 Tax=Snodgrassella sp. CFCC 13594 TaxID=1775559 RepID=UPI00083306C1|nr:signal peptidase II [Snodgrassella sp. CFCC 13594]
MQQEKVGLGKYMALAAVAIVLDQLIKTLIVQQFSYMERVNVIPNFFDLTLVYNPGAAFSFLADAGGWQKFFFMGLAVVICAYLIRAIAKNEFGGIGKWGAAMIVGGAIGNVVDRLIHGHVIDFLLFYYQEWYYPAFNIADSFICVGAVLLVIDSFRHKPKKPEKNTQAA